MEPICTWRNGERVRQREGERERRRERYGRPEGSLGSLIERMRLLLFACLARGRASERAILLLFAYTFGFRGYSVVTWRQYHYDRLIGYKWGWSGPVMASLTQAVLLMVQRCRPSAATATRISRMIPHSPWYVDRLSRMIGN